MDGEHQDPKLWEILDLIQWMNLLCAAPGETIPVTGKGPTFLLFRHSTGGFTLCTVVITAVMRKNLLYQLSSTNKFL